jgi:uncharacterized membrane protein YbhN (UPF0104 family)
MGAATTAPDPARRWRRFAVRLGASALFVALLVAFVPWRKLVAGFSRVPPAAFAAVVGGFLCCHFFGVFKWRMVIGQAGARLRPAAAIECYAAGLFSNIFLPSIVGGDVLRALLAGKKSGRMAAAILGGGADRLLDLAALGLMVVGAGGLVGLRQEGAQRMLLILGLLVVAAAAVVGAIVLVRRPLAKWPRKLRRRIAQVLIALRRQGRRPLVLVGSLCGAIVMQSGLVALQAVLGRALELDASPAAWIFAWALAKLAGLAPVSFNGIGVRDTAFAMLFVPLVANPAGLPREDLFARALAASFVWQAVLIVGSLLSGAVWMAMRRGEPRAAPGATTRHG